MSAATSRAMPSTLMQSPRFGVRLTSSTTSSRPSASTSGCAGRQVRRQLEQAGAIVRQAELARRAEHAERFHAAQLRLA